MKLTDVAQAAGVSAATVSRALRSDSGEEGSTAARVRRVAEELGYVRYGPAAALSSTRSGLIGLRFVREAGPLEGALAAACEQELESRDQACVVRQGGAAGTRRLLEAGVAAIVAVGEASEGERALAASRGVRFVDVGARELDFDRGAEALAGFFLGTGHRSIAVASRAGADGGLEAAWAAALRGRCEDVSLAVSSRALVMTGDADEDVRQVRHWLDVADGPTALACGNDVEAACVLRACGYAGVAVPGALSVAGIGDSEIARLTTPTLTSVRLPLQHAAAAAVEAASATATGWPRGASARNERARLVVRGSTGPAGGR